MKIARFARPATLFAAALAALMGAAPVAHAQNGEGGGAGGGGGNGVIINKPNAGYGTAFNISALGGIGSYGNSFGVGFGGIVGIPIVKDGFVPSLNESFHLEFGAFTNLAFLSFRTDAWFSPVAGVRWDFHIFEQFTAYAAFRGGVAIAVADQTSSLPYFDGLIGGFWRFSKPVALRFEFGGGVVGTGVTGGVAFFL